MYRDGRRAQCVGSGGALCTGVGAGSGAARRGGRVGPGARHRHGGASGIGGERDDRRHRLWAGRRIPAGKSRLAGADCGRRPAGDRTSPRHPAIGPAFPGTQSHHCRTGAGDRGGRSRARGDGRAWFPARPARTGMQPVDPRRRDVDPECRRRAGSGGAYRPAHGAAGQLRLRRRTRVERRRGGRTRRGDRAAQPCARAGR